MLQVLIAKAVWQNKFDPAFACEQVRKPLLQCIAVFLGLVLNWRQSFCLILNELQSKCFCPFIKGLRSLDILQCRVENPFFLLKRMEENSATYFYCTVLWPVLHSSTIMYLQDTSFNQPTCLPADNCYPPPASPSLAILCKDPGNHSYPQPDNHS